MSCFMYTYVHDTNLILGTSYANIRKIFVVWSQFAKFTRLFTARVFTMYMPIQYIFLK